MKKRSGLQFSKLSHSDDFFDMAEMDMSCDFLKTALLYQEKVQ